MGEAARFLHSRALRRTTQFITALTIAIATIGNVSPALAAAGNSLSVNDYSQCANGAPGTSTTPPNGCTGWINGDLNQQNSQYREDQVVPQRLVLTIGSRNTVTEHTIQLQYLARKGSASAHSYDSLATWNYTQGGADKCQGLSGSLCVGGAVSTLPISPDPTNVPPATQGTTQTSTHQLTGQVWTMYGGTLISQSGYTHSAAPSATTDDQVTVTVTYHSTPGATVMLLFGGHLAAESGPRGWGSGLGAASINGGPYHISLMSGDGGSIGGKDNNIQSNAILGQASLSITKTADSPTVNAGGQVGFTITVTNNGNAAASGVTVNDNLPNTGSAWSMSPNVSGCSISGPTNAQVLTCSLTIAANGAVSIHVVSTATNPAACGTLTNTATFTSGSSTGSAGVPVTVTCPALKVTKTADAPSVNSTQPIGFTVTVQNTGNGSATNVTLTDPLPGGTGINWSIDQQPSQGSCTIGGSPPTQSLSCSFGNLASGASVTVHVKSATTSATSGTFNNTATAHASNAPDASGSASETVNAAMLQVTKTPDAASVSSGTPIGFTITVKNNSSTGTALGVTLSDPLPTGTGLNWAIDSGPSQGTCSISGTAPAQQTLNCSFGDIGPGGSATVHVKSPTTAATSGTFTNIATAQATNNPPTTGTGSETVNQPSLHVTKTPDAASVSSGSPIGFLITVSNSSPNATATSVTLSDPLPLGTGLNWAIDSGPSQGTCSISGTAPAQQTLNCSFGNIGPSGSVTVHVKSPTTAATSGTFTNTATAQGTNTPPTSGSGSETVNKPSLQVTKTPDAASVSSGDPIGFLITVKNNGPGTATAVTLSDILPLAPGLNWAIDSGPSQGTCSISGTAPAQQTLNCSFGDIGPSGTVTVHVKSPTTAQTSGVISNTAVAQGTNTPPTSGSGSETVNQPSLHIGKTADSGSVSAGDPIAYTITVSNSGPGTAKNVVVTDNLPSNPGLNWSIASVTPTPVAPDGCAIAGSPQVLTCNFASLVPGASYSIRVTSPTSPATCGAAVQNIATVNASNATSSVSTATVTINVNCPNVGITKTPDNGTINVGSQIGYTITVKNTGTGTAHNVTVNDALPNNPGLNWSIESVTPSPTPPDGCSISNTVPPAPPGQVLTCHFANLAPNASVAIHIVSPTTTGDCGTISNVASVTLDNGGSAQTLPSTVIVNCAVLHVSKTGCPSSVVPGGLLTYTISYSNGGAGSADNAVLVDTIPNGTQVADAGGGTVATSGNTTTVTWNLGTITAGGSGTKTLVLLVTAANGATLTNQVKLSSSSAQADATFSVTTPVTNAGAITHGSAYAADVSLLTAKLINQYGLISTVGLPGSPQDNESHFPLGLTLPNPTPGQPDILDLGLLEQDSHSSVTTEAVSTASSTVLNLSLLGGAITADAVRGVSQSIATPNTASYNSTGSNFVNLVYEGRHGPVALANVAPNTTITVYSVPLPGLPSIQLASVKLYEESGTSGFANSKFSASHQVNMIHVKLLSPLGGLASGAEVIVAHANTDATYPSGLACGAQPNTVSGKAFTAYANGTFQNTSVATAQVGDAELPTFGGSNTDTIATVVFPPVVTTSTGTNATSGSTTPNPNAQAFSVVHTTNLLDGLITADLIDVKSSSSATGTLASTTFGSTCGADACPTACVATSPCFVNLAIRGLGTIVGVSGGTVAPNTRIAIPQPDGSLILVILNEQITGGDGTKNTEGTINAIHVYVLKGQAISLEVIVGSAHSDAHHS